MDDTAAMLNKPEIRRKKGDENSVGKDDTPWIPNKPEIRQKREMKILQGRMIQPEHWTNQRIEEIYILYIYLYLARGPTFYRIFLQKKRIAITARGRKWKKTIYRYTLLLSEVDSAWVLAAAAPLCASMAATDRSL
jgi:hypothetical protein